MTIDNRIQVVLIDDDPHLRQALGQTLDLAGLKILPLSEAKGLAAQLERDWPGVVVSDIRMPGMDGLELLERIARAGSGTAGAADHRPRRRAAGGAGHARRRL